MYYLLYKGHICSEFRAKSSFIQI